MEYNTYLNIVLKLFASFIIILIITHPEAVGHWKAQMEIAYDQIWIEYIADCDCMEAW